MTDIDLEVDGLENVFEELEELEDDWGDDPVWLVGAKAEYAVYLEFGTRDMPPYPFFRPAIREFQADPEAFIDEHTQTTLGEIEDAESLTKAIANALERQIKINATAEASGRSPGVDSDHPQVQTGNLRAGIEARRVN